MCMDVQKFVPEHFEKEEQNLKRREFEKGIHVMTFIQDSL